MSNEVQTSRVEDLKTSAAVLRNDITKAQAERESLALALADQPRNRELLDQLAAIEGEIKTYGDKLALLEAAGRAASKRDAVQERAKERKQLSDWVDTANKAAKQRTELYSIVAEHLEAIGELVDSIDELSAVAAEATKSAVFFANKERALLGDYSGVMIAARGEIYLPHAIARAVLWSGLPAHIHGGTYEMLKRQVAVSDAVHALGQAAGMDEYRLAEHLERITTAKLAELSEADKQHDAERKAVTAKKSAKAK